LPEFRARFLASEVDFETLDTSRLTLWMLRCRETYGKTANIRILDNFLHTIYLYLSWSFNLVVYIESYALFIIL